MKCDSDDNGGKILGDNDAIWGEEGDAYQVAKEDKLQSGPHQSNHSQPDSTRPAKNQKK